MGHLKSLTLKYHWWFGIFRQHIISKVTYHREQVSISSSQKNLQSIGTNFNSFTMILIFHGFLIIRFRIKSEFFVPKILVLVPIDRVFFSDQNDVYIDGFTIKNDVFAARPISVMIVCPFKLQHFYFPFFRFFLLFRLRNRCFCVEFRRRTCDLG